MADDFSEVPQEAEEETFSDPVAERSRAYCLLLVITQTLPVDSELFKESFLMLKAIRLSFKQIPVGDLRAIDGGKRSQEVEEHTPDFK